MRIIFNKILLFLIILIFMINCFQPISSLAAKSNANPTIKSYVKNFNEFIPLGWKLNYKVDGDFNKDNLIDSAAVIEQDITEWKGNSEAPKRILIIAFKQKNNSYKLSIQTSKAILRADEGGIWGDPFYEGLTYSRGSLVIDFYGGSNYRWGLAYRFRFQNSGWYLIGATILDLYLGTGEETIKDYNLLTGKMIITTGQEGGKVTSKEINRGKKKLLNLKDFYPWVEAGKGF